MALAGATGAYLLGKRFGSRRAVRLALTGLLVLSVVVSVPIAFGGLSVYSYKGVTTTGEFAASTFAHERVDGPWASDDHLVRISRYHPPDGSGTVAPVYTWVHDSSAPPPDCPALTKDSWTTAGAQFYPRPPEALADDRLEQLDAVSHRVYHGGSSDRLRLFQSRNGSSMERC